MILIKLGGSILNPDGRYDEAVIEKLMHVTEQSPEQLVFVIGGGVVCREIQQAAQPLLDQAKLPMKLMDVAKDEVGIAVTKINAHYLLSRFQTVVSKSICPELITNPDLAPPRGFEVYFATGNTPGSSTDYDLMRLAKTLGVRKVMKITSVPYVKDVKATEYRQDQTAKDLHQMSWQHLLRLVAGPFTPGGHYPLDPQAAMLGAEMGIEVFIGTLDQLEGFILGKKVEGTTIG